VEVHVARPAVEPEQNDRRLLRRARGFFRAQQLRQSDRGHTRDAELEEMAAVHTVAIARSPAEGQAEPASDLRERTGAGECKSVGFGRPPRGAGGVLAGCCEVGWIKSNRLMGRCPTRFRAPSLGARSASKGHEGPLLALRAPIRTAKGRGAAGEQ